MKFRICAFLFSDRSPFGFILRAKHRDGQVGIGEIAGNDPFKIRRSYAFRRSR